MWDALNSDYCDEISNNLDDFGDGKDQKQTNIMAF